MIRKPAELFQEAKSGAQCLTAEGARLLKRENPETVIVDVREPEEVAASAIDDAINIPRGVLEMKIGEVVPQHDRPLLVCCASGGRAALASRTLQEMGYTDVKVIDCPLPEIAEAFS